MRLSDFIMQEGEEKKFTVLHQGVLIGKRKDPSMMIFLFQLDDFYVEMYCNAMSKEVTQYKVFRHTRLLQPYLESIAIDHLLKE